MKHLKYLKTLMMVMILSLLTTVAISCGDEEDPIIYTVTVMTAEGGSADASRYEVIDGEEVTLTAEPEEGYKFKCWMQNGAEVSTANPYTFIVNRNIVYIAKFIKEGEDEDGEEGDNSDQPSEIKTFDILAEIEKDEMVFVQGGSYNMGATEEQGSEAKADESPVHLVMLSDYYISRYEITQKFWETIMGNNPSGTKGDDLPVDNVSWEECNQFIQELNKRTGKNFSLPTEAEWEYAARGGEKRNGTKYSGSNNAEEVAWSDALDGTIQPVGTKKYNDLGIYDMSGNVSEWCYDWYGAYTEQDQTNPIGATAGTKRVLRGGNISSANTYCRVSTRNSLAPDGKQAKTGFRIVLSKPTYKVTAKPSTEEGGSITLNNGTKPQYVKEGVKVTLTATPKENNHFVNWTLNGAEVSKEKTFTPTITQNGEYIANFGNCKITVTASEGGTAKTSKTQVEKNEQVTLTATPNEGYSFVNWTVEGKEVSTQNPYTTTITKDLEIKANFITHKITVIASEGGTAKTSKTQVGHNGQVTLTATPQEGYSFVNWTVDGVEVSTKNPYTATITEDVEYKANFITHKITVIASEGGTAKTSKTQVGHNGQVTLTATPNEDYGFVNWTVNGVEVSTQNPYTITITKDIEIKANFIDKYNGHEYVDLGLPSGIKWATCNVGATTPEGYGDYFAWGETSPKTTYNWSTYKYCNGDLYSMTKYCTQSSYGTVDNKTTLELSDDAARVNLGGSWRMPTKAEQDELRNTDNCTWTWTTQNGVNGYKVTSKKNGNSIFLPEAGCRIDSNLYLAGSYGNYWSSSLRSGYSDNAYYVEFNSVYVDRDYSYRCRGRSVRPICE